MKLYKRDGRRFVEVQDVTGMFFQKDGSFTKTKNEDTIGVCVLQTASVRKVVLLETIYGTWHCCDAICRLKGAHMPSRAEMYLTLNFFKNKLLPPKRYWTKDNCKSIGTWAAWIMSLYIGINFSNIYADSKSNNNSALAFKDIQI